MSENDIEKEMLEKFPGLKPRPLPEKAEDFIEWYGQECQKSYDRGHYILLKKLLKIEEDKLKGDKL